MTPSRVTKVLTISFSSLACPFDRMGTGWSGLADEQRIHLADCLPHALGHAHAVEPLHGFASVEDRAQFHPGATAMLSELHGHYGRWHVGSGVPVLVGESVPELQRLRRVDRRDSPPSVVLLALRTGHEVTHVT